MAPVPDLVDTSKLEHEMAVPSGWPSLWLNRELPGLVYYTLALQVLLCGAIIFTQMRQYRNIRRGRAQLADHPHDATAILEDINKRERKATRTQFKIGLAFLLNAVMLIAVDGAISVVALVKDTSDNPGVWDRDMVLAVALYVIYLLVLFVASFVLVPLLQIVAITWGLTRFSRKNRLSDHVPQARALSTAIFQLWAMASFYVVCHYSIAGTSDDSTLRFVVWEAVWGSALAWLEASFMFNYLSHAIGDKELHRGNGVGEIVSLFAKAASTPFSKSKGMLFARYEQVAQGEPADLEKQAS